MDTAPEEDAPHGPSHIAVIAAQPPNAIATGARNTTAATINATNTHPRLISRASITDGSCAVKIRGSLGSSFPGSCVRLERPATSGCATQPTCSRHPQPGSRRPLALPPAWLQKSALSGILKGRVGYDPRRVPLHDSQ